MAIGSVSLLPGGGWSRIQDVNAAGPLLELAEKLGLFRKVADDSFEELAPRLIQASEQAIEILRRPRAGGKRKGRGR